jgi:hypothetical protein
MIFRMGDGIEGVKRGKFFEIEKMVYPGTGHIKENFGSVFYIISELQ